MADEVPQYQTLLWASSTVYIYLSALFHAIDFRVTGTPFLQTQVHHSSSHLAVSSSAWMLSRLPPFTHLIPAIKSIVARLQPWCVRSRRRREAHQQCHEDSDNTLCESLWPCFPPDHQERDLCLEPELHTPLRTSTVTSYDNKDSVKFSPHRGRAWEFPHIPKLH